MRVRDAVFITLAVLRTLTKKRQSFCKKSSFSSFCRRIRRLFVVFLFFISFRRLGRFSHVRKDCFLSFFVVSYVVFFLNEIVF